MRGLSGYSKETRVCYNSRDFPTSERDLARAEEKMAAAEALREQLAENFCGELVEEDA